MTARHRITAEIRAKVVRLLQEGHDREAIAALVGVTPAQVSAVRAHVSMGSYDRNSTPIGRGDKAAEPQIDQAKYSGATTIYLGTDLNNQAPVFWDPAPSASANPHVLIVGETGSGKTYATTVLIAELAKRRLGSVVIDYGQGFDESAIPPGAWGGLETEWIDIADSGIALNPLSISAVDVRGPTSVAQRVSDSFARIYPRIGVQQHSILREAILEVFHDAGIKSDNPTTWRKRAPEFTRILVKLESYAVDGPAVSRRHAGSAASHISTLFLFKVFRATGQQLAWSDLLSNKITVLGFRGLEPAIQKLTTEFILWNLIGHLESVGPHPLHAFVVLDEAHRLSFAENSPVEKLLREARKFGIGLLLASQQPEDFSPVAFANTATKIVFQVTDHRSSVSRNLHRKVTNHTFAEISGAITRLARGFAYVVTQNVGHKIRIASFEERSISGIPRREDTL